MGHDRWVDAVRAAHDGGRLIEVLEELPRDGLQLAGNALLPHVTADGAPAIVSRLVVLLIDRGWEGDAELAAALAPDSTTRELRSLPVDLEDLGNALDESEGSEGYLDLETGQVWPGELFDMDGGPEDADLEDETRWMVVRGLGPSESRRDMRDFAVTIDRPALREQLLDALEGRGGHRRFRDTLSGHGEEFTRWHRFRNDRLSGRARAWLADAGYRPAAG